MTGGDARRAALCAVGAVCCFSYNDVSVKWLSGDYALHQVILIRSVIGMTLLLAVIAPLTVGRQIARTRRLGLHLMRGACVVTANMLFFLGLAALPLAEAVAIFFIAPLLITVFSVVFLGEHVGPRRWGAVAAGMLGVLVVMRPGAETFQAAALLPVGAAVAYAGIHILGRRLGPTESAATMAFYIQATFIVVTLVIGLAVGDGRFGDQDHPSLAFLLRAWGWPASADWPVLIGLGVSVAMAGYLISQAYRLAEAAFVAPFEYIAMPMAVLWGMVFFDETPDAATLAGVMLILVAGLYVAAREGRAARVRR